MDSINKKIAAIVPAAALIFGIYVVTSVESQIVRADTYANCGTGEIYYQGYWFFYSRQCDYKYQGSHLSYIYYIYNWWYSRTGSNPWFYDGQTVQLVYECPLDSGGHITGFCGNV